MSWFKNTKYRSQPMIIDNVKFSSKKEASRYVQLKVLSELGEIKELVLQPKFILQESFYKRGIKRRAIHYIADFQYIDKDGITIIEDVKGYQTTEFKIKLKLFEFKYPELTITLT